jgi:hypothetical protein
VSPLSYDLSKNLLKLWWIKRSLIVSLTTSLSLIVMIYLTRYSNELIISIMVLVLSIETIASMRSVLRKFYEVLNLVGAPRRIITTMISLNTLLSLIPLLIVSLLSPPPAPIITIILLIVLVLNYLLAKRKS